MSTRLRISAIISSLGTIASILIYLWLLSLWEARSGAGLVVFYFWALLTMFVTIPCDLITIGLWIAEKNQAGQNDGSLKL